MAQLVLLVLAAVWLAVLIPPLLRSRVENRPNSSVTDFRRQLTKLENTATPTRGAVRAMGRPLAQSPMARPAGPARSGQPTLRSGLTRRPSPSELAAGGSTTTLPSGPRHSDHSGDVPRSRTHGDPSGGHQRPAVRRSDPADRPHRVQGPERRDAVASDNSRGRVHGDPSGGHRRPGVALDPKTRAKRRRTNVLFALVVTTACSLFLAATTESDVMWWLFVVAFLGLLGYVYLLGQTKQRSDVAAPHRLADSY